MRPLARTPLACAMTIGLLPPDCRAQAMRAVPRQWLSAHADMPAQDMGAALDADLRRAFGGRRVYVQRQPKAERLARLAALPPDTPIEAAARAIGVSVGHLYELRKLARGE